MSGDFNADIGNSLGEKGEKELNQRGRKLTEFANFFKNCPVNFLKSCIGPMETYYSHCGRYRSTLDYIFLLSCLLDNILMAKTFDLDRIVGIKCDFPNYSLLFILIVYFPSMNDKIEDFNEYFDYLWALYDTLSTDGYVIVLGILGIL